MRHLAASLIALLAAASLAAAQDPPPPAVEHRLNTGTIPRHAVLELDFRHDHAYADPFFDVTIAVTFTAPSGRQVRVGGFFYGSDQPPQIVARTDAEGRRQVEYRFAKLDLWKARFVADEVGRWTYAYTFTNAAGAQAGGEGSFACVEGRRPARGFVRIHPENPTRFVFDDGSPYFPVGIQDGVFDGTGVGSVLATAAMEGPFRTDRPNPVELPAGPAYVRGPSSNPQNGDVYFRRYARGGFNLLRFSQRNFSLDLYRDLDHYLVQEAIMVDELLRHARKYDFRILYGLFGYMPVFTDAPGDAAGMAKVRRFIEYSVNRWGAYVDIWELLNEQHAQTAWYDQAAPLLREIDPYHHPVTTSWERPELPYIDINAPHWYQNESPLASHSETAGKARQWLQHGKPVIVGEQGNWADPDPAKRPPGVGGVWDAGSATRMRIRTWTALFNEISFVFWVTNYARDGHHMNIWLGPQERQYVRALQDFAYRLDAEVRPAQVATSRNAAVRAYGLLSPRHAGVYLVHFANHDEPVEDLKVWFQAPRAGTAYWYDPASAELRGTVEVREGTNDAIAPPFTVDLALLIAPDAAPDIDGDGVPNDADEDDDGDGVPDAADAFPLEPEEQADADGDGIGDSLDADRDGDGRADDANGNGTPDGDEMDLDGDGVPRAAAVPWDAFPDDPAEWRDTDGDGVGDNADADDDGDGWPDAEERAAGTDPLDPLRFPAEGR